MLNPLLNKLFKLVKRPGARAAGHAARCWRKALAWSFLAWIFNGLQIWILADKFGAPAGQTILIALGGYAFAWCVGFVVVFAPAGAGVRDVLLIAALAPVLGTRRPWRWRWSPARSTPSATCSWRAPPRRRAAGGGVTARTTLRGEKTRPRFRLRPPPPRSAQRPTAARTVR